MTNRITHTAANREILCLFRPWQGLNWQHSTESGQEEEEERDANADADRADGGRICQGSGLRVN